MKRYLEVAAVAKSLGAALALVVAISGNARAATPPATEATAQAGRLWKTLLTQCGTTYFYAGSELDKFGRFSVIAPSGTALVEYRGALPKLIPVELSEADRLNGLDYRGRLILIANVYRLNGGAWQDGPAARPRSTGERTGQVVQDLSNDGGQLGNAGAIAIDMRHYKGRWVYARASTYSAGVERASDEGFLTLPELRVSRYDCATGHITRPPPTAEESAAQQEKELHSFDGTFSPRPYKVTIREARFMALSVEQFEKLDHLVSPPLGERGKPFRDLSTAITQYFSYRPSPFRDPASAEPLTLPRGTQFAPVLQNQTDPTTTKEVSWDNGRSGGFVVKILSGPQSGKIGLLDVAQLRGDQLTWRPSYLAMGPPSPEATAAKAAAAIELNEMEKAEAEEDAQKKTDADASALASAENAKHTAMLAAKEAPWRFAGRFAAFKAKFAENLRLRAQEFGLDAGSFHAEIDRLFQTIDTCLGLTREEYAASVDRYGRALLKSLRPTLTLCQTSMERVSGDRSDGVITFSASIARAGDLQAHKRSDNFHVTVFLSPKDKSKLPGSLYMEDMIWRIGVIDAEIPFFDATDSGGS